MNNSMAGLINGLIKRALLSLLLLTAIPALATEFEKGPLIKGYGSNAKVTQTNPLSGS